MYGALFFAYYLDAGLNNKALLPVVSGEMDFEADLICVIIKSR